MNSQVFSQLKPLGDFVRRYLLYIWYGPGKHAAANMSWPTYLRHWSIWKSLADYFPVRLIKTAELDASKRYIFG